MTDAAAEKLVHEALSSTLARTGDWLKFAETKNAALLTFSSAWLIALGNLLFGANPPGARLAIALAVGAIFIFASAATCLLAILPRLRTGSRNATAATASLLYYGDLDGKNGSTIYKEMKARFLSGKFVEFPEPYLEDLASEISGLSRVAARKYRLFNGAATIMALAPFAALLTWMLAFAVR